MIAPRENNGPPSAGVRRQSVGLEEDLIVHPKSRGKTPGQQLMELRCVKLGVVPPLF
jgi:hypothetical protein